MPYDESTTGEVVRLADYGRAPAPPSAADAVRELNRRFADGGLDAALDVGRWILGAWFEGNPALFRARSRSHAEFRATVNDPGLGMSYSFLWNAVAVTEQYGQLPRTIAAQLTLAHHRVLLPVRSPALKLELAERVIAEGLSKRDLIKLLQDDLGQRNKRGRKPLPGLIKGLRMVRRGIEQAQAEPFRIRESDSFGVREAEVALRDVERDLRALERLAAELHRQIGVLRQAV